MAAQFQDLPALVPVFIGEIAGQSQLLCNARDLHAFLQVGRDFSTWFKDRIASARFIEGEDFSPVLGNRFAPQNGGAKIIDSPNLGNQKKRGGDRRSKDYHLTLDMAKHLGLMENNDIGHMIRRHFIAVEKAARGQVALPAPKKRQIRTRDDLSFTQRDDAGRLINWAIDHDRNENWGERYVIGQGFLEEIAELAAYDEEEAYYAVCCALSGSADFRRGPDTAFGNTGWGQESGFADAVARAVIDGLRRRTEGNEPFNPDAPTKRGRKALPKSKRQAQPSLPAPAQLSIALH